jgi:glucosylglycerate hydrolase
MSESPDLAGPGALPAPEVTRMAVKAGYILGANSSRGIIKPAPRLYPHQWSWDTAFIVLGLAHFDVPLARHNLDALFAGQWRNGMVPHIVFDQHAGGYFPGPDRWDCRELSPNAPAEPQTSGICQPPVHALAAASVLQYAGRQGADEVSSTARWFAGFYPKLLAWHRFLARERVDARTGLVGIFHGWESGMDNSPRWDGPYSRVKVPPTLPPYQRLDLGHVTDAAERPTNAEYDRYLWLVEEAKLAGYDQAKLASSGSFHAGDVFFTAIFAAANERLAGLSDMLGAREASELRSYADAARSAVLAVVDAPSGLAADVDLRTGELLTTECISGFAPLVSGKPPEALRRDLVRLLMGPRWAGDPKLRWPVPPSTSPGSSAFRARSYWRGPTWPVTTWLLSWALERDGERAAARALKQAGLEQLEEGTFAEYYEPYTGEPLGSAHQSWTAAVTLDWAFS